MSRPVFRFAPSPNGRLHLGHALSALVNAERAQAAGGRFLLRFEDIDTERCRPEYEEAIREDLAWLGIAFEEQVRRQSEHFDAYRDALAVLDARGLLVRSFATRREIATASAAAAAAGAPWPLDPDGMPLFPGDAALLSADDIARRAAVGEPAATRLAMQAAIDAVSAPLTWAEAGEGPAGETGTVFARPEAFGDVVLARKETPTSYHLSVVVDDALQGVTHVVRGADLFAATAVHRLLQALLGLPEPVYHHHRLVLGPDGRKLAKSNRDTSLAELRAGGATPSDIRRMVGLAA